MKILIIDDEQKLCDVLEDYLLEMGPFDIEKAYDGREALKKIKEIPYDLIICDIYLPFLDGIELTKKFKHSCPNGKVILISGRKDIPQAIQSLDAGVFDFLAKPVDTEKLAKIITDLQKEGESQESFNNLTEKKDCGNRKIAISKNHPCFKEILYFSDNKYIVASSSEMKVILKKIQKIYDYPDIPILLEGRTGTGKEVIAEYLHYYKPNPMAPFVAINCGAIPSNIFESEMFGYEKGAFTGADPKGKIGKIKAAEGGTLFLDEISEMPLESQAKLLRVIEEKEYFMVGGNKINRVNARIICATNKNLSKLIKKGLFREDLFYRLNVCKFTLSSLTQRKEAILPLVFSFIIDFNTKNNCQINEMTQETMDFLINFSWPGNIRQLKNAIVKAMLFNEKKYLSLEDFCFLRQKSEKKMLKLDPNKKIVLNKAFNLEEFNKKIISAALEKFNGNKSKAAHFLGLNRIQMYYRYNIDNKKTKKDQKIAIANLSKDQDNHLIS